jgi:rare lipoprotein A (peptidoglycan hydrolase)
MSGRWRSNCTAGAIAAALLLTVAAASGCGTSDRSATATGKQTASRPAVSRAPRVATGGSPKAVDPRAAARSPGATAPAKSKRSHPIPPAHPVPAAFQPAAGAPSDAEVRRELAQMAAVERKQHQAQLSAAAANLAGLLPWTLEPRSGIQVSVASVFRDYGLGLACGGVLGRDQLGVAHKTAPCGTMIAFTYGGRTLTVPVIDRGPYIAGREWDLTGAAAEVLAFPGLGQIQWQVVG